MTDQLVQTIDLTGPIKEKLDSAPVQKKIEEIVKEILKKNLPSELQRTETKNEIKKICQSISKEVFESKSFLEQMVQNMILADSIQKAANDLVEEKTNRRLDAEFPKHLKQKIEESLDPLHKKLVRNIKKKIPEFIMEKSDELRQMTLNYIDSYIKSMLPSIITSFVTKECQEFFASNPEFQRILAIHSNNLNMQLENNARSVLSTICQDPSYHQIVNEYLTVAQAKSDDEFNRVRNHVNAQITRYDEMFEKRFSSFAERHQQALNELNPKQINDRIDQLEKNQSNDRTRINNLLSTIDSVASTLRGLNVYVTIIATSCAIGGVVALFAYWNLPSPNICTISNVTPLPQIKFI